MGLQFKCDRCEELVGRGRLLWPATATAETRAIPGRPGVFRVVVNFEYDENPQGIRPFLCPDCFRLLQEHLGRFFKKETPEPGWFTKIDLREE